MLKKFLAAAAIAVLAALAASDAKEPFRWPGPWSVASEAPEFEASASLDLAGVLNGGDATVTVTATSNVDATYYARIFYRSSYPLYNSKEDTTAYTTDWQYKTRAVGLYDDAEGVASDSYLWEQEIEGVYHSDTLFVDIVRTVGGTPDDTLRVASIVVNMPIGDAPTIPDPSEYQVTATHNGGTMPSSGTVAQWSLPDVLLLMDTHIMGRWNYEANGYDHLVDAIRDEAGSNNYAVLGFSDMSIWEYWGVKSRLYYYIKPIWTAAIGTDDENIFAYDINDDVCIGYRTGAGYPDSYMLNILNPLARQLYCQWFAIEWNHSDNRLPFVGILWDVPEYDNTVIQDSDVDLDRDGTRLSQDADEQFALRQAWRDFASELRAAVAATSADPDVGDQFLIGLNGVRQRSDYAATRDIDFLMLEDMQCDPGCGTGLQDDIFRNSLDQAHVFDYSTISYVLTADSLTAPNSPANVTSRMGWSDGSRPKVLAPESHNSCSASLVTDPEKLEAICLLWDYTAPFYLGWSDPDWVRTWNYPTNRGKTDLHGLGAATESAVVDTLDDGDIYAHRAFENGMVQIIIPSNYVCLDGESFEYKVTLNSVAVRQSDNWAEPGYPVAEVTADYECVGSDLRILVDLYSDEPATYEVSYSVGIDGTRMMVTDIDTLTSGTIYPQFDTGATCASVDGDTLYVWATPTDATSNVGSEAHGYVVVDEGGGTTTNHYYVDTGGTKTYVTLAAAFAANDVDLVVEDEIHIFHVEASTGVRDSVQVNLGNYRTDSSHYIKVVGDENHGGEYDPTIYRLYRQAGYSTPMVNMGSVDSLVVFFEDMQFYSASTDADGGIFTRDTTGISIFDVTFERCVMKGPNSSAQQIGPYAPVRLASLTDDYLALRFYSCLMYGWHRGFHFASSCTYDVAHGMNNTSINCYYGFSTSSTTSIVENCITWGVSNNWASEGTVDYNACDTGVGPGVHGVDLSGYTASQVFSDATNGDYHLVSGSPCYGNGVDLSAYILDDIDGDSRSAWSIGMDEGIAP